MTPLRKRLIEDLQLRNYAELTIKRYVHSVECFAKYFNQTPERLGPEQIRDYLLHLLRDKKAATNTIQVHRAALSDGLVRRDYGV